MPHLLIVEDERDLARLMARTFLREGFSVAEAASAREARAQVKSQPPSCVLLDLMLPDASGLEICRELKGDPLTRAIPVVMVTARGEEVDRVVGFELGADDYVTKPFSPRELVLRVKAILRRLGAPAPGTEPLRCGPLTLDEASHRALENGRELSLTALEFKLLSQFMHNAGRVQTRDQLLEQVWGYHTNIATRTLDTHIKRLRQKLKKARSTIETVRGVGYRLTPPR